MPVNLREFDSLGVFSIDQTTIIDKDKNAKELNSLEIKNSFYADSKSVKYILRGANSGSLQLDDVGTLINIENNTINFITGQIIAVNPNGTLFAKKLESAVFCNGSGAVSISSTLETTIKDDIPEGETWDVVPLGSVNNFTYNTTRAGTTSNIKWIAMTDVVSIAWS